MNANHNLKKPQIDLINAPRTRFLSSLDENGIWQDAWERKYLPPNPKYLENTLGVTT